MEQNLQNLLNGESVERYEGENIQPGVICFTVFPFVPKRNLQIITPLSTNPASPDSRKYRLLSKDFEQLRDELNQSKVPPHYELGLRRNEVILAVKAKDRPVVVLSPVLSSEETSGFPPHFKGCVLCAPLYTLVDGSNRINPNYSPGVVNGVIALKYSVMFPVITCPYLGSRVSGLRLDRIMPVRTEFLHKTQCKVTDKWFDYICAWVRFYATGQLTEEQRPEGEETIGELLTAARELLAEALNSQSNTQ